MVGDRSALPTARPRRLGALALRAVAAVALLAVLAIIATGGPPASGAAAFSLGVLAIAAEVDRRSLRLPDRLLLVAALPIVSLVVVGGLTGRWIPLATVLAGALIAAAPVALLHIVSPTSMGFGDVKAAVVLGAALGLLEPRLAPAALAIASLTALVVARIAGRRRIALGPHLVVAALAVATLWTLAGPEVSPWR